MFEGQWMDADEIIANLRDQIAAATEAQFANPGITWRQLHDDLDTENEKLEQQIAALEAARIYRESDGLTWKDYAKQLEQGLAGNFWNAEQEYKRQITALTQERDTSRSALNRINDIRNSIVGTQTVNWSEHIYPLLAALNEAGLVGLEYEEAKANIGTLLQRLEARGTLLEEMAAAGGTWAEFVWTHAIFSPDNSETMRRLVEAWGEVLARYAAHKGKE